MDKKKWFVDINLMRGFEQHYHIRMDIPTFRQIYDCLDQCYYGDELSDAGEEVVYDLMTSFSEMFAAYREQKRELDDIE